MSDTISLFPQYRLRMDPDSRAVAKRNMRRMGKKWSPRNYDYYGPLKFHKSDYYVSAKTTSSGARLGSGSTSKLPSLQFPACLDCGRRFPAEMSHYSTTSAYEKKDGSVSRLPVNTIWSRTCRGCLAGRKKRAAESRVRDAAYAWLKSNVSCVDCGRWYSAGAMEFDHLPEFDKVGDVSAIAQRGSLSQFIDEIAKCEIVCANCHRVRTDGRS